MHVVDGSDPDPAGQIRAVRAVLADIGAGDVPELIVINKADRASADALAALRTQLSRRRGRLGADRARHRGAAGA